MKNYHEFETWAALAERTVKNTSLLEVNQDGQELPTAAKTELALIQNQTIGLTKEEVEHIYGLLESNQPNFFGTESSQLLSLECWRGASTHEVMDLIYSEINSLMASAEQDEFISPEDSSRYDELEATRLIQAAVIALARQNMV